MNSNFIQKILSKKIEILSLIAAAAVWEFISVFVVKNEFFLPSFHNVVFSFIDTIQKTVFLTDVGISLYHFGIGFFYALLVGIPIGMLMGWFPQIDKAFNPIVEIFRPIPPLAWIPFAIIWFGLLHIASGFIIFIGMVFPIILSTYSGFKNVSKIYVEAAKVLGCSTNGKLIRHVAIPAASPLILSGIRTSMGVGWMCLAASEMFGVSDSGIGFKIWYYYGLQNMGHVVVYMLILGFVGLLLDFIFRNLIQDRLLKWQKGTVI
ncbi:MAG: ABC transporter permease [Methanimicrococcus sp.]|nr:ABC transporter permease [Methanimicrococcus sp.]